MRGGGLEKVELDRSVDLARHGVEKIQDHAQDRPGRRAVSNTHSRRRAERACRGINLIGRRAFDGRFNRRPMRRRGLPYRM